MSTSTETIEELATREYKYGFYTDVESETIPKGLSEDVVRLISQKKQEPEWLLEWRLKAYRLWLTMKEPTWQNVKYDPINYQDIIYYSAPKKKKVLNSLDEVDPEVRATFKNFDEPRDILYTLVLENGHWRIDDIQETLKPRWTMSKILLDAPDAFPDAESDEK